MNKNKKLVSLAIALSVVATVLSIYLVISLSGDSFDEKVEASIETYVEKKQEEARQAQAPEPTGPVDVSVDNDAVKGDSDAPVTIIEFSDFECPFCGRHFSQTMPDIQEKYIDTGKVKYVFRDFPLSFHQNAMSASLAAECVKGEGGDEAFWEYHDTLYNNQQALDVDSLKGYASDMGYDIADCLDSEKYADEINADFQAGQAAGVRGTPAFFINGNFLSGAQPFSAFEAAIEAELDK